MSNTPFYSKSIPIVLNELSSSRNGISTHAATRKNQDSRLHIHHQNKQVRQFMLLIEQFKNPMMLILLFAAILSFFLGNSTDSVIIFIIIGISGILSFWQEYGAADAVEKLLSIVELTVTVIREGKEQIVPAATVVPGDILKVSAGCLIAADSLLIESNQLYADEASLTGETFPVEKYCGVLEASTLLAQRTNVLFMGTHVVSGTGLAVAVNTHANTEFGKVSDRLRHTSPETEFASGIRHFGYFLMEITLILTFVIFAINIFLHKPILDSFLFSLALAIGLTPQLLPAIISINLAHGAKKMAANSVIVKKLSSIENLGSMNILCTDKTGTLTEGKVVLHSALDIYGNECKTVLRYAFLNSVFESGFINPIDAAIKEVSHFSTDRITKLDEVPYDFVRKRLSVLLRMEQSNMLITKGSLDSILEICSTAQDCHGAPVDLHTITNDIRKKYKDYSAKGMRLLGVAIKDVASIVKCSKQDEFDMIFLGLLLFEDPLKIDSKDTIHTLQSKGVSLKIITGDNELVAAYVGKKIGITKPVILSGKDMFHMSDHALALKAKHVDIFAAVEPNQKERIIIALKKSGNTVGYLGDGINDASALHVADVGISVESAVDVAKEAADIILLKHDLHVIINGVQEGRITFANTMKYIFMATSANFGNMFSMAGASIFLPFLPLLPKQILLLNLATDFPELAIASDAVDVEWTEKPMKWNLSFIKNFMVIFGTISSIFDCITFAVLVYFFRADQMQFQSAWFLESVVSATLIVLVIRSRRSFFKSMPSTFLLTTSIVTIGAVITFLLSPLASMLGFTALHIQYFGIIFIIVATYVFVAENVKQWFYTKYIQL